MRRFLLALMAMLVLLPSAAHAAPLTAITHTRVSGEDREGPAIGAGGVLWVGGARALTVLRAPLTGGSATTLFSDSVASDSLFSRELSSIGLAASPTRIAFGAREVVSTEIRSSTAYSVVRTATPGGKFAVTAGDLGGRTLVSAFDLSGDLLATVEEPASDGPAKAYVRDLAAGGAPRQVGPDGVIDVEVAGGYVALGLPSAAGVAVYDRATGAEVYRVADVEYEDENFVLQEDGTVAVSVRNPQGANHLAWASIADPKVHVVAERVGGPLQIAGNRILFARTRANGQAELALTDLAGAATPASFPVGEIDGADFDGSHVAFSTGRCVYAGDVPDAQAAAAPPLGTCPQVDVGVDAVGKPTTGQIRVRVSCRQGPATGCTGSATLRNAAAKGRRPIKVGTRRFTVAPGASTELRFKVSARTLRSLRRSIPRKRKTAAMVVTATAVDAARLRSTASDSLDLRVKR